MRGGVSIILEACLQRLGRNFLLFALFGYVQHLSAQDPVGGPLADRGQEDFREIAGTVRSPAFRQVYNAFLAGDYARVCEDSRDLMAALPGDSPDLEALRFMEGLSLFHAGFHDEAQLALDRYLLDFPQGSNAESVLYHAGSNLLKRRCWRAAGRVLDEFPDKYPESVLMDQVLYDRATVYLALHEHEACYAATQRLTERFPLSPLIDRAAFLKGEVLKRTGKMARAESAFITAKKLASKQGNAKVAAHALCRLIEVACEQGRYDDAADYYAAFFRQYPGSSRSLEAASAGLPALEELGRIDFALNRMEDVIMAIPDNAAPQRLLAALGVYGRYFGGLHGFEGLIKRLRDLPMKTRGKHSLHEALIVARLEVLEKYFTGRDAEVEVFYDEIRSRLDRHNLSAHLILKVARHVARYDKQEAALWLVELLERPDIHCRDEVIVVLADVHASTGDTNHMRMARKGFESFLNTYATPRLMEQAILGLARVSMRFQHWKRARECWRIYLSNTDWKGARGEAIREMERLERFSGIKKNEVPVDQLPKVVPFADIAGPAEEVGDDFSSRIESAERLMRSGFKEEALAILGQVITDGVRISQPGEEVAALIQRAGLLRENLQFALRDY
jgi:outer membrane protein assembly factor BamD (BamD/ComL family)